MMRLQPRWRDAFSSGLFYRTMECGLPGSLLLVLFVGLLVCPVAQGNARVGIDRQLGKDSSLQRRLAILLDAYGSEPELRSSLTQYPKPRQVDATQDLHTLTSEVQLQQPAPSRRLLRFPSTGAAEEQLPLGRRLLEILVRDAVSAPVSENAASAAQGGGGGGSSMSTGVLVIVILIPTVLGVIMVTTALAWMCRRTDTLDQVKGDRHEAQEPTPGAGGVNRALSFGPWLKGLNATSISRKAAATVSSAIELEYSLLQVATNDFSVENLVGEGGFGCVYKAQLDDKTVAAVKKLDGDSKQGEREFQSEVDLMSKVRHPNLVSLLGFCSNGDHRLLVYEYMQNGSLQDQLHGPSRGSALSWHMRIKIALEAARGLEHLHEHCNPPVIHRDFKSSNILLDANLAAKVADFGLALPMPSGVKKDTTLELQGTFGYVAPEYFLTGTLTEKSDVYGFGVVLLELLTGRKPVDPSKPTGCESLVTWATPQLTVRSKLPNIIDPFLRDSMNIKHLYQVAAVAALCVQTEPSYRPLIADVVHSLIPLVPLEFGGALRTQDSSSDARSLSAVQSMAYGQATAVQ